MPPVHYRPGSFPPDDRIDWKKLIPLLGTAHEALTRYDCLVRALNDVTIALVPIESVDAVLSTRMAGVSITVSDVCAWDADDGPDTPGRVLDMQEFVNHGSAAVGLATVVGHGGEISQPVLLEAHARLMQGPRGEKMRAGEYRRNQTWTGPPESLISQDTYVPIAADALPPAMDAWEAYLHAQPLDQLVQLAVLIAEFMALRPFQDGNGRLARMLVKSFLWMREFSTGPCCFISNVFHTNREECEERLLAVWRDDDWTSWCYFFLEAVIFQMRKNELMADEFRTTYARQLERLRQHTRSPDAWRAVSWTFRNPSFGASRYAKYAGMPPRNAHRLLDQMRKARIVSPRNHSNDPAKRSFANLEVIQIMEHPPLVYDD